MDEQQQRFLNYSNASKARQAMIPPEIRKARASAAALAKWKDISKEERREHALKMVEARIHRKKTNGNI